MVKLSPYVTLVVLWILDAILTTEGYGTLQEYEQWIIGSQCKLWSSSNNRVANTHAPYVEHWYRCPHVKPRFIAIIKCEGVCRDPKTGQELDGYVHKEKKKPFCVLSRSDCVGKICRPRCYTITSSCECQFPPQG